MTTRGPGSIEYHACGTQHGAWVLVKCCWGLHCPSGWCDLSTGISWSPHTRNGRQRDFCLRAVSSLGLCAHACQASHLHPASEVW